MRPRDFKPETHAIIIKRNQGPRSLAFSREWENEKSENTEAQAFWNESFNVFGVSRRRLASFEEPVKRARKRFEEKGGKGGFIDLLWKGQLIAEHKSRGKDLDSAYKQALEYFEGIAERDLPRYIVVSDFARIRLYDLDSQTQNDLPLKDLYKHIKLFGFIAGYSTQQITPLPSAERRIMCTNWIVFQRYFRYNSLER